MESFLFIVIAIILVVIVKSLQKQADNIDNRGTYSQTTKPIKHIVPSIESPAPPKLSYGEKWVKDNPQKASAIESSLGIKLSQMEETDVKEIVDSFTRMAHANNVTDWSQIKVVMLNKLTEMVDVLGEEQAISILNAAIQEEVNHTHANRRNTSTNIGMKWLKESIEKARNESTPFSSAAKFSATCSYLTSTDLHSGQYSDTEKNEVAEQFKNEYITQIMNKIGDSVNIPLFANGYDSPVAREIMHIMYSYLRNPEFINKAKKDGLWNKLFFLIIEETNKITDKYCDADVQECIEFYNFPNKPVITSRRCPTCGSRKVFCEEIGDYECMECGRQWHAMHGRNTYSDY